MIELPKNPYNPDKRGFQAQYAAYNDAQQDMRNAGYRQVPSVEEIRDKFGMRWALLEDDAKELNHWLLGGKE